MNLKKFKLQNFSHKMHYAFDIQRFLRLLATTVPTGVCVNWLVSMNLASNQSNLASTKAMSESLAGIICLQCYIVNGYGQQQMRNFPNVERSEKNSFILKEKFFGSRKTSIHFHIHIQSNSVIATSRL